MNLLYVFQFLYVLEYMRHLFYYKLIYRSFEELLNVNTQNHGLFFQLIFQLL